MEENKKVEEVVEKKKKKKLPLIILVILIVICAAFGVLCVTGQLPILTKDGFVTLETAALLKKAANVEDEATLRELLLMDAELEINVTKDIEINETFIVNGKKTLYGDTKITADIFGLFAEKSIFQVQGGAVLIVDGLVLDGGGMADGIVVNQRGNLIYKSGKMQYVRYGISSNSEVTVEDVDMQHIATAGVLASFRSKVYVKGGTYYDAYTSLLRVESGGYMEIEDGVTAKLCKGDAIYNEGTLRVYGGTFSDTTGAGINNIGDLVTEYKGSDKDGYIKFNNIGRIGVRIDSSDDNVITDIYATNVGTNGMFVTDKETQGNTTVENCIFDTTGSSSGNTFSLSSKVDIKDVTIKNSQKGSVYVREGAEVSIEDLTIENCNGSAMSITGSIEGKNITINGATNHGIDITAPSKEKSEVVFSGLSISGVAKNNFLVRAGASATVSDSVFEKSQRTSVYVSYEANLVLDGVEVQGVIDKGLWSIVAAEKGNITLQGDSVVTGGTRGGVCAEKNATFTMADGKITGIDGTADGSAVYLRGEGTVFNMTGGILSKNIAAKAGGAVYVGKDATFNMKGGSITGNQATNRGGGVYVLGTMNFTGGTITGNKSKTSANGILNKGAVIVSGNAYMAKDDIGLDSIENVMKVKGSTLKKHSKSEPLLITAPYETAPGTKIVECDSNNAAVALAASYVASGTKAYSLYQLDNSLAVSVNKADMDMTGADKVYVTNYEELKEAVETTTSKRYVIIGNDIEIGYAVTVPQGKTVYIRDDGVSRTISRGDNVGSNMFRASYGTGLYLVGTSKGSLVLDGTTTSDRNAKTTDPLVRVKGGTEIRNVSFVNNQTDENGGFVRHDYGDTAIYSSTFNKGNGNSGGALYAAKGTMHVEDCVFENNSSVLSGGAIRTAAKSDVALTVVSSEFKNNTATTLAGAINCDSGTVEIKDSNFVGNKANNGNAGAIGITNVASATISGTGTFKGNSAAISETNSDKKSSGGAIYTNNSQLTITGYTFDSNSADNGGAVAVNTGTNNGSDPVELKNVVFLSNSASEQGGAIHNAGRTTKLTDCTFGGTTVSLGNTAGGNGGAIYIAQNGTIKLVGNDKQKAIFENNKSTGGNGGAVCIGSGNLEASGYEFNSNSASNGGAINLNNAKTKATLENTIFVKNEVSGYGGAINNNNSSNADYILTITGCEFGGADEAGNSLGNKAAERGGAIFSKGILALTDTDFTDNESQNEGGAIGFDGGKATVTDCNFTSNASTGSNAGAISIRNDAAVTLSGTGTFDGNKASASGGAFYLNKGTLHVNIEDEGQYTFDGNLASWGGVLYIEPGREANFKNSIFIDNESSGNGGAIYNKAGTLNATACKFSGTETDTDGNLIGNVSTAGNGGAIYSENYTNKDTGNVTSADINLVGNNVANSLIEGNRGGYGAAIYVKGGELNISGYLIKNNISNSQGGAIYLAGDGDAEIKDSELNHNFNKSASGGAIYMAKNSSLIATNTDFIGNEASSTAGAINCDGGDLTVTDCNFTNNKAKGGNGGAISTGQRGEIKIQLKNENCSFQGNTATGTGGAINTNNGNVTISGYTFTGNKAKGDGGAIYIGSGTNSTETITISSAKFYDNHAGKDADGNVVATDKSGGAIYNAIRNVMVTGCTFGTTTSANTATSGGGAIYNKGVITVEDTDFDGNSAGSGGAILQEGQSLTIRVSEGNTDKVTFANNYVTNKGGAIRVNNGGTLKVTGYTFEANRADSHGGAILTDSSSSAEIVSCTFGGDATALGNTSKTYGGAIYTTGSADTTTIKNTSFKNNSANRNNADVYNKAKLNIGGVIKGIIYNEVSGGITVNATEPLKNSEITMDWATVPTNLVGIQFVSAEDATASAGTVTLGSNAGGTYAPYFNGSQMLLVNKSNMLRTVTNYDELSDAMTYVKDNNVTSAIITIAGDIVIPETVSVYGNVTFIDDGTARTISRGLPFTTTGTNRGVMFDVESGATVTFKSTGTDASPKLTIDGKKAEITQTQNNWAVVDSKSGAAGVNVYAGVKFVNNRSGNAGGVFLMEGGTLNIYGGLYEGNSSTSAAGVIELKKGTTANIEDATFRSNSATHGGVIEVNNGTTATITNCTFESNNSTKENNAAYGGGAIYIWGGGTLDMENCMFTGNGAATNLGIDIYVGAANATVKISGEMVVDMYNAAASQITVDGALTDGSDVTIDWKSALPANNEGILFTSDDVMNASKHYISLGGTQFATYSLVFVNQKGILETPISVTDFAGLKTAVETTIKGQADKTGVVRLANSFDFTGTVTIPADYNVTIEDNGSGDAETLTKKAAANMFVMSEGATVTFRSSGSLNTPKLIINGNDVPITSTASKAYAAVIYGGGILNCDVNILEGVKIQNNISKGNGSVIYFDRKKSAGASYKVYIDGASFYDNVATGYAGGAFSIEAGYVEAKNSVFNGNEANYGGAFQASNGTWKISNCRFEGNTAMKSGADYGGGAIYTWGSVVTITDCEFISNTAANGGAIYNRGTITFVGANKFESNTPKDIRTKSGSITGDAEYTTH